MRGLGTVIPTQMTYMSICNAITQKLILTLLYLKKAPLSLKLCDYMEESSFPSATFAITACR